MPAQEYLIDGDPIDPQPIDHEWEDRRIVEHDGDGFPIYAKYSAVVLRVDLTITEHHWRQYVDGATHTITLPARDTRNDFTQYTSVIIEQVTHGPVPRQKGIERVEMRVIHIEE